MNVFSVGIDLIGGIRTEQMDISEHIAEKILVFSVNLPDSSRKSCIFPIAEMKNIL